MAGREIWIVVYIPYLRFKVFITAYKYCIIQSTQNEYLSFLNSIKTTKLNSHILNNNIILFWYFISRFIVFEQFENKVIAEDWCAEIV